MSDARIDEHAKCIKNELQGGLELDSVKIVVSKIEDIEKIVSSHRLKEGHGDFIIQQLYLNAEPSDCCNGCVQVPKLYHAYKNEGYLQRLSSQDLPVIEQEVKNYLEILENELS